LNALLPVLQPTPRTRAQCAGGPRPCPHLDCRYHLAELWGATAPHDADTCALDVADRGEHGVEDLARLLGAADATLSEIETVAKRKLERFARNMGFTPSGAPKLSHARILDVLRTHGPLGRSELAELLGLSKIRITALLASLKRAGKVESLASNTWQLKQEGA
jgi:DNA-binding transcriptional ArsR family regulator